MKCFNHLQADGVAICKSCGRSLCHDCCTEVDLGCACKGRCEDDVHDLNIMLKRGKTAYQKTGGAHRRNAAIMLVFGLVCLALGILPIIAGRGYATALLALFGFFFVLWAYFSFVSAREISSVEK